MASDTLTTAKPACDVSDIDAGDTFRFILRVSVTLDRAGRPEDGTVFWLRAIPLKDYSRALTMAREYVEVVP
jgi:hypothetical protein